jgi:hypothetical protein
MASASEAITLEAERDLSMPGSRVIDFVIKEFREALPPIVFFFVSFNLVELTTQLILAEYLARLANYMIATTTALVVGKAVLVADALPFLRRFDAAPMIRPILFKTTAYWAVVFVFRVLEGVVEYWFETGTIVGAGQHLVANFDWHRFAAIQIWMFVLFLVYTFVNELNSRLGKGALRGMLFGHPATSHPRRPA